MLLSPEGIDPTAVERAARLGREFVVRQLLACNVTDADARVDRVIDDLVGRFAEHQAASKGDGAVLARLMAEAESVLASRPDGEGIIADVDLASASEMTGMVDSAGRAARDVILAMGFVAFVLGVELHVGPGGVAVDREPGLSPETVEALREIGATVRAIFQSSEEPAERARGVPRSGDAAPSVEPSQSSVSPVAGDRAAPPREPKALSEMQAPTYLQDIGQAVLASAFLDGEEIPSLLFPTLAQYLHKFDDEHVAVTDPSVAQTLARQAIDLLERLNESNVWIDRVCTLFEKNHPPDTDHPQQAVLFGAGVFGVPNTEPDVPLYRVAIRLQCDGRLKSSAFRLIRQILGRATMDLFSIRWTDRLVWCQEDIPVRWLRRPWGYGAPVGPLTGALGSAGVFVTAPGAHQFVLSAGHVFKDQETSAAVYAGASTQHQAHPIGVVQEVTTFRRPWRDRDQDFASAGPEHDIAVIRLEPGNFLGQPQLRRYGLFQVKAASRELSIEEAQRGTALLTKGESISPAIQGRVTAAGLTTALFQPATNALVTATGLVEVELDAGARKPPRGASGTAVFDSDGVFIGILVAVARRGYTPGPLEHARARPLLYVQPIDAFLRSRGWKVA